MAGSGDDEWDEQMKRDLQDGKLDQLLNEADDDIAAGRLQDLLDRQNHARLSGSAITSSRTSFSSSLENNTAFGVPIPSIPHCISRSSCPASGRFESASGTAPWLAGMAKPSHGSGLALRPNMIL